MTEIWHLDDLTKLLSETLETIDKLDSSGMTAPRVDEIRNEIAAMNLDERHRTNLWMTTDNGNTILLSGEPMATGAPYEFMTLREIMFLASLLSIVGAQVQSRMPGVK